MTDGIRRIRVLIVDDHEMVRGVNGHVDVPSGGREISPYTVMSSAPPAAMRFPQSRESGWV